MTLTLDPPAGTRFPNSDDERLAFEPMGALRGRVDFGEMLAYHAPGERRFTLLAVHESWISAAACFEIRDGDIFVDYLARNELFRPTTFVSGGSVLVAAIEGFAARLGIDAVRLESVEDPRTRRWYEAQGFASDSPPRAEEGWGMVYPMVKRVERFAGP